MEKVSEEVGGKRMRIEKYDSNSDSPHGGAYVRIDFSEKEINYIDNVLYEATRKDSPYEKDVSFLEIYNEFHLIREFINHGRILKDEVESSHKRIKRLENIRKDILEGNPV